MVHRLGEVDCKTKAFLMERKAHRTCISWEHCAGVKKGKEKQTHTQRICKIQETLWTKKTQSTKQHIKKNKKKEKEHKATKRNRIRDKLKGTNTKSNDQSIHILWEREKSFILCSNLKKFLSGFCLHCIWLQEPHNIFWSVQQKQATKKVGKQISVPITTTTLAAAAAAAAIISESALTITSSRQREWRQSTNRVKRHRNHHNNSKCLNNIWKVRNECKSAKKNKIYQWFLSGCWQ